MTEITVPTGPIVQPPINDSAVSQVKRYVGGSERSRERLEILKFDPIENLVKDYEEIQGLIQHEYKLRDGHIKRLHPSTGKEMAWYPDLLEKLLDKRMRISENLLRYGYGRVTETSITETKEPPKFGVILT